MKLKFEMAGLFVAKHNCILKHAHEEFASAWNQLLHFLRITKETDTVQQLKV